MAGGSSLTGGSYIEVNGGSRGGVGNAFNGEINFVSGGSYQSSQSAVVGNYNFKTQWNGGSATLMHIDSSTGQVQINTYGSGTFTGTVARNLAVDSSGNIIENQANTRSVFVATSTDTTTNINATTTVNWNSESIKDTGFTHSNTTNPNEITITQAGTYKVYASITYTTTVQRANIALEILVNDVSTGARGAGGYVRSASGHNDGSTIVEDYVTVSANDVVKIQTSQEAQNGTVNLRSGESKIIIEKLTGLTLSTTDANTLNGLSSTDFVAVSGDAMTGGLTIDGDLGVGTSSPSNAVHVVGNGVRIVSTATNANSGEIRLGLAGNNSIPYFEMGNSSTPNSFRISNAGYYQLGTTVDTDLRFNVNNNTAIHIESTNKFIGLNGVTSPLSMLSINNVNSQIGWQNSGTVRAFIGYLRSGNDTNLRFGTSLTGDSEATEKMRIDSSGNVGIGTTSPSKKLHVVTTGSVDVAKFETTGNAAILIERTASTQPGASKLTVANNGQLGIASDNLIKFSTSGHSGGTERMRINNDGNVGIGTSSPSAKLQIQDGNLYFKNDSYGDDNRIGFGNPARNGDAAFIDYIGNGDFRGSLAFGVVTTAGVNTAAVETVRFDKSGNVGIGTTTPGEKLSVSPGSNVSAEIGKSLVGNIGISGYAGFKHQSLTSSTSYALLQSSTGQTFLNASSTESISFRINNDNKMTLTNGGDVGIGTTSPGAKLEIRSGSGNKQLRLSTGATTYWELGRSTSTGDFEITEDSGDTYFLIDKDNGNVGIGTTSPDRLLVLNHASDTRVKLQVNGTDTAQIQTLTNEARYHALGSSTSLQLWTNGAEKMRIDSSGNVGIGTTSPSQKLEIFGKILLQNNDEIRFKDNGGTERTAIELDPSNNFNIGTSAGGNLRFINGSSYTERMRITGAGYVGIGTDSPARLFHVKQSSSSMVASFESSSGTNSFICFSNTASTADQVRLGSTSGNLVLSTFYTERMRIDSSGNVGIGTTSPSQKLHVKGDDATLLLQDSTTGFSSQASGIILTCTDGSTGNPRTDVQYKLKVNSNTFEITYGASDSQRFKIESDGGLFVPSLLGSSDSNPDVRYNTTTGELYYNSSSIRYKEDVTDIESTIDKINKLRPVKFKVKESQKYTTGLIAEEVVEVIPEIVFKRQIEGFDEPQIDGVVYNDLHAYYIKAIQEQQEMINELKTEIQTLKSQINS